MSDNNRHGPFSPSQSGKPQAGGSHWQPLSETLLVDYLHAHQEAITTIKGEVSDPLQRVEALSKLAMAMDRTFRALDRGSPEQDPLTMARLILERQSEFVREKFPDHLPLFLEILEPFGNSLLVDDSWQSGPFAR